jgi:hypothetical protein
MTYANQPVEYASDRTVASPLINYHDQVRWGPIVGGLVIALSTQLVLSTLGAAVGLTSIGESGAPRSEATGVGVTIGIWSIISLLIALFVGGWTTTRTAGRMSRTTALLNGAILWASMLVLSAWLLSSGVTGAFGIAISNAGSLMNQAQSNVATNTPVITAQQTRDLAGNVAKVSWFFVLGSILGLGSALLGAGVGCRHPRSAPTTVHTPSLGSRD